MKIKVDAVQLRKSLSELLPFAKVLKEDKDAARTAKFQAEDGILKMYTGDVRYNHYVERTVAAQVLDAGEASIEIRQALDVLSTMDTEVTLEIKVKQSGTIRNNRTTLPLRGSVDDIIKIPMPESGWVTVVKASKLISAAIIANKCRRQDDGLYYDIDGLCILPTENGTELVGTDGNHLVAVDAGADKCVDEITVCQPHLARALSYYNKKEPVEICIKRPCVWLRQGGKINVVGLMHGEQFQDYHQILDKSPRVLGEIEALDAQKIVTLIRKKILEPNPLGLVSIEGKDNSLIVCGKYKKYQYACPAPGIELERTSCNADGLALMLSMFEDKITLKYSKKEEHLYLTDDNQLAILKIMEDFLRN